MHDMQLTSHVLILYHAQKLTHRVLRTCLTANITRACTRCKAFASVPKAECHFFDFCANDDSVVQNLCLAGFAARVAALWDARPKLHMTCWSK